MWLDFLINSHCKRMHTRDVRRIVIQRAEGKEWLVCVSEWRALWPANLRKVGLPKWHSSKSLRIVYGASPWAKGAVDIDNTRKTE